MKRVSGSFRDPSGYVYVGEDGGVYRTVNEVYRNHFEKFVQSGLCDRLLKKSLIVSFEETPEAINGAWKTLCAEKIPFISYPYEWSFSQLKDAALTTLDIQLESLKCGMSLKDASAYNIQFLRGLPVFIDLLSFETYREGMTWSAYRQFIMHFYGPLALMAGRDLRDGLLMRNFMDGIPLDYISSALNKTTWLNPSKLIHIHLHSMLQQKYADTKAADQVATRKKIRAASMPFDSLVRLVRSLKDSVEALQLPAKKTEWGDYYNDTNYTEKGFSYKKEIVGQLAQRVMPKRACDLGANDGEFSRVLAKHAGLVISSDYDPIAVEKNYSRIKKDQSSPIFPVLLDLCNPSPGLGWANQERDSFVERAQCDLVMGLALIHHLCISNNLPLSYVAEFFRSIAPVAIVEFVPKEDGQVQRLLQARDDIFPNYSLDACINAFLEFYPSVEKFEIPESRRTMLFF